MADIFTYTPNFIANPDAALASLQTLAWVRRETTPRLEYYANRHEMPYTYGSGRGVRTYEAQPWSAEMDAIAA